jgi:hypothetical protein
MSALFGSNQSMGIPVESQFRSSKDQSADASHSNSWLIWEDIAGAKGRLLLFDRVTGF